MDFQETAEHSAPDNLLRRVRSLERRLKAANQEIASLRGFVEPPPLKKRLPRPFDASRHSYRLIALKFAYLGQNYNGYEHHNNNKTPLPTIEEVLWKALVKAKLINPQSVESESDNISWEGCDYSKCGRTDRGVSAFGQVIGIRVRSNRPPKRLASALEPDEIGNGLTTTESIRPASESGLLEDAIADADAAPAGKAPGETDPDFADSDEIPYAQILNRLLPPDIRILAWCPAPAQFSARFSCRERRYRYFFTQPAFMPTPGTPGLQQGLSNGEDGRQRRDGWLDIDAMKVAAKKYEGLHDFRNLCKVDASKQLDNFTRKIFVSEIREVDPLSEPAAYVVGKEFSEFDSARDALASGTTQSRPSHLPRIYQFVLHGSAFLWHQVRHMVAILFLVGQGLEQPSLVDELLDIQANPGRPNYEMAEDAPLVLWDCIFPDENSESREDALPWIWVGNESANPNGIKGGGKFGHAGVVDELWSLWRKRKIDEILAGSLLNLAVNAGGIHPPALQPSKRGEISRMVFQGGDTTRPKGNYIPVMQLPKLESVEIINAKYRERKGIEVKPPTTTPKETRHDHMEDTNPSS